MRIESNYRDYYDNLQRLTPGDPDVWHRVQEYVDLDKQNYLTDKFSGLWHLRSRKENLEPRETFAIYFCGKLYLGLEYSYFNDSTARYAFNKEEILNILGERKFYSIFPKNSKSEWRLTWEQYLEKFNQKYIDSLHLKYNAPVIYENRRRLIINPMLSAWHFQSVIDPYTAFQEIDMFRNSFLKTPERPMVQISDKDRIVKKGFDLKTSFRKPKQT